MTIHAKRRKTPAETVLPEVKLVVEPAIPDKKGSRKKRATKKK